ncbi:hypothetical protein B4U79_11914 [Dinothrombium tinctorium]|uniref:BTB domain-containing protein n=1 Tax=Dinothrombium tinctorium TaxID=1965070 RepID=A0A443R4U0_9ACAR|nr:hypothetical protein B4U79_11914 [Dinothrombium tinctorium]
MSCDNQHLHEECNNEIHDQQIDNSSTILEKIAKLYAERLLSDIILEVDGQQFAAHRLILCASSDVFQVMLMNPKWSESQETRIVLHEDPLCVKVFPEFLRYLYIGRININHILVLPLLTLADKYNVKDLVKLCVDYMCHHIVSAAKHNLIVSWLQYTINCGHKDVYDACIKFVKYNFELIAKMDDYGNLETDVLITFLQKSDLVITDEYTLFNFVTHWLSLQESKTDDEKGIELLVPMVMQYIRYPNMSPHQLASLLLNPFVIRFKEFFVNQMSLAMAFHSNKLDEYLSLHSTDKSNSDRFPILPKKKKLCSKKCSSLSVCFSDTTQYTPRLYTSEKWSSTLVVDNYRNLPIYGMRTLVFQTSASLVESDSKSAHAKNEWVVDLYPKGVWFKKFFLILWQGTLEMPECVLKTVRLSLTSLTGSKRVNIGILMYGKQNGIEHVCNVYQRRFSFTEKEKMLNVNDLIPFDELNSTNARSSYLTGPDNDTLKVQIVITP